MQPDLKKLITAFLGVALIASVFSFAFIQSGAVEESAAVSDIQKGKLAEKNAFADISLITPPWRTTKAASALASITLPSSNLTESYAYLLSRKTVASYQVGLGSNGEPLPVTEEAVSQIVQTIEGRVFEIPALTSSGIKVNDQATLDEKAAYVKKARDLLQATSDGF